VGVHLRSEVIETCDAAGFALSRQDARSADVGNEKSPTKARLKQAQRGSKRYSPPADKVPDTAGARDSHVGVRIRNHLACSGEGAEKKTKIEVSPEKGGASLSPCPNEMTLQIIDRKALPTSGRYYPQSRQCPFVHKGGHFRVSLCKGK
jgi:hypothetical protein